MEKTLVFPLVAHTLAGAAIGWCVLAAYRWIRARSALLGWIVAAAILARVVIGLTLFWVSYTGMPIAASLQVRGGFWVVALDAAGYFQFAAAAVEQGELFPLDHVVPAPVFVNTLAMWMMLVGVSPAAGLFLNLCLYLGLVGLIVWCFDPVDEWRRDLPCIVAISSYSFAPVILLHSTQPLKDEFSNAVIAVACVGIHALRGLFYEPSRTSGRRHIAGPIVIVAAATFAAAGVRWYFAIITWAATAMLLGAFAIRGRTTPLLRYVRGSAAVLLVSFIAFTAGAGPYAGLFFQSRSAAARNALGFWYDGSFRSAVLEILQLPRFWLEKTSSARTGFLASGGNTNIIIPVRDDDDERPGAPVSRAHAPRQQPTGNLQASKWDTSSLTRSNGTALPEADDTPRPDPARTPLEHLKEVPRTVLPGAADDPQRAVPRTPFEHLKAVTTGLAIIFVPISLVQAIANVDLPGGRGLLPISDLDTIWLDASIALMLVLLWKRRHALGHGAPVVLFGLLLSAAAAVLMGYVVTNFGTLWRLRAFVAVPVWVLGVALTPEREARPVPSEVHGDRTDRAELVG